MSWNLEGLVVRGRYLDQFPIEGVVTESRVKYGGKVCHHVRLFESIVVYGAEREQVVLDEVEVIGG